MTQKVPITYQGRLALIDNKAPYDLLQRLNHPTIPIVIEVSDDNIYLEFKPGQSLDKIEALPEQTWLNIGHQLLLGIKYLHGQNMMHGDIKPSNLVYDDVTNKASLIDFQTLTDIPNLACLGTPRYVRPGLLPFYYRYTTNSLPPDLTTHEYTQTDLYGLGVSLYESFTGQFPFGLELLQQHMLGKKVELKILPWQANIEFKTFTEDLILNHM